MWQRVTSRNWGPDRQRGAWPGERIRVLVENPSSAFQYADFSVYADAGIDVALCSGPMGAGDRCPVVDGEPCPLVAAADVVVCGVERDEPEGKAVLDGLLALHPGTAVLVEVPREGPGSSPDLPSGCVPLPFPSSVEGQIRLIRRLASR